MTGPTPDERRFAELDLDPYEVIGVDRDAPHPLVKRRYHAQARLLHPDSNLVNSTEPFRRLQAAWEILREPGTRARFDQWHARRAREAEPADPGPAPSATTPPEDPWDEELWADDGGPADMPDRHDVPGRDDVARASAYDPPPVQEGGIGASGLVFIAVAALVGLVVGMIAPPRSSSSFRTGPRVPVTTTAGWYDPYPIGTRPYLPPSSFPLDHGIRSRIVPRSAPPTQTIP